MKRKIWQGLALVLALVFVLVGLFSGEGLEVLRKAAQICLECIGLG